MSRAKNKVAGSRDTLDGDHAEQPSDGARIDSVTSRPTRPVSCDDLILYT
jgi:hypothetical protein